MALPSGGIWEVRNTATANMVNGGGFNPSTPNFLTDLAILDASGTTASPTVHSESYSFVAGDVGAKVFVGAGTNWNIGWFPIVSVAGGDATVDATLGSWVSFDYTRSELSISTVTGIATVASPTAGTFGIDFSQQDSPKLAIVDLVIDAVTNTKVSSALTPFNPAYVGNILHTTAGTGFTVGWFEVGLVVAGVATLDRAAGTLGSSGGTAALGGALSFNSALDDDFCEAAIGGNKIYFKSGTTLLGETVNISSGSATFTNPIEFIGYNTIREDKPTGADMPIFSCATNVFTINNYKRVRHMHITGTGTTVIAITTGSIIEKCTLRNTSTTATRNSLLFSGGGSNSRVIECDIVSQNGYSILMSSGQYVTRNRIHDTYIGISLSAGIIGFNIRDNLFENCINNTLAFSTGGVLGEIIGNTIYGIESKTGVGLTLPTAANYIVERNIFYGLVTGISGAVSQIRLLFKNNNFFNNTTDLTNIDCGSDNTALNPQFTGASQVSGTTATSTGSVLTQAGGDFSSVTDGDYLTIISGTGLSEKVCRIDSHTGTTLTCNNSIGESVAGDIVYYITTGNDFRVGTNLKGIITVALTTDSISYSEPGAFQREEVASGGGGVCVFIS